MLAAMADMALSRIVAPLGWTAVLAGLGIALGARLRPGRPASGAAPATARRGHALHRALAFIVGAWAFAAAGGGSGAAAGAGAHEHGGAAPGLLLAAAIVAMTAFAGWLVAAELGDRRRARAAGNHDGAPGWVRHAAEAAWTTVMLAAMAVPSVVAALA
jgi:hypothetical protein